MAILDDICAQIHGQSEGADQKFQAKLDNQVSQNEHYQSAGGGFIVHHYAGQVGRPRGAVGKSLGGDYV